MNVSKTKSFISTAIGVPKIINYNKAGFTLVELIVVLAILAILAAIIVPSFAGYRDRAKEQVCKTNCSQLERMYQTYLVLESNEHSETVFAQYLRNYGEEICPDHGEINYVDGKVYCSVHSEDDGRENEEDEVPYL